MADVKKPERCGVKLFEYLHEGGCPGKSAHVQLQDTLRGSFVFKNARDTVAFVK